MQKSGQITVFLSLALLCIFSLMCGLIESARMAGARCYLKLAADSAMDSVFSEYHREAWDQYRLFLLEAKDEKEIKDSWNQFMEPYMDSSGWYGMAMESAEVSDRVSITDDGGSHLDKEILDYMKYGIIKDMPDADGAADLLKNLKEASSVESLSQSYSGHTKEAVRLERALEDINDCLRAQKDYWETAQRQLGNYNGSGFRESAQKLKREMDRIPSLVTTYGKRADQLKKNLDETKRKNEALSKNISPEMQKAMAEEANSYETYVNQDGPRRNQVEALPEHMDIQKTVIQQAMERAEEVEDTIDNWVYDDEEDSGPDFSELWGSVEDIWNRIQISVLSYSNGVKDPEKQRILEQIEGFAEQGLLNLVLPEGSQVSKGMVNSDSFPSASMSALEGASINLLERLVFEEYCSRFLTNFCSEEEKEFKYELEYLISGKTNDEDNLKRVVTELVAIREGMNLIHILSDSEKRQEANALASVITGVTGLAPLTGVIAFFIMTVWALGEAIVDVKMLLEGKKTAFIKSRETWNLTLSSLLELGKTGKSSGGKAGDKGIDYTGYLKLLMFLSDQKVQNYRLMDMIQWNLCKSQGDFRMENCVYQAEIKGNVKAKHLFFGGSNPYYPLDVRTEKAY
ncbi:DUF5702 domain-containing protein [Lacrimispora xylanolytica]|uniref:DUF5702 domain-containing protein n=1 Tax=Lacrimispora xylanolytica TaxID=29375 RepID=A0ABY7AAX9_9FIRM|nr:DUF5702 domain-containing protein [Lacrimispora xylanolytica]WAJ23840.1 DUF5702 domain-containing protein [Lacrimispora xylanolytica]